MATAPAKSPLHNFPLTFPKWGSKSSVNGHQRCRRPADSTPPPLPQTDDDDDTHLNNPNRASGTRPPAPLVEKSSKAEAELVDAEVEPTEEHAQRHWNLRPRRPPPPPEIGGAGHVKSAEYFTDSESLPKSARLRSFADGGGGGAERREKRKFSVALTKEEIEEDIYALTGSRPSRRPRKRPRNVQKQLDSFFPGLWLVGVSPEAYRSLDAPAKK